MAIRPVRMSPVGLAATVKVTLPLPVPSVGEVKFTHVFVFCTVHVQVPRVVMVTARAAPAAGTVVALVFSV